MDDALTHLAAEVGLRLKKRRWMLATAESCTGGWVAAAMTAIAGSSEWFERGFVTYSNEAKHEMLGVPAELIERHGAVSEEVARAMAVGALRHSRARGFMGHCLKRIRTVFSARGSFSRWARSCRLMKIISG